MYTTLFVLGSYVSHCDFVSEKNSSIPNVGVFKVKLDHVKKVEMDRYCRDTNTIHQFRGCFITDAHICTSRVRLHHTE